MSPGTDRAQYIGGMTWGLSMALLEESVLDEQYGDYLPIRMDRLINATQASTSRKKGDLQ